MKNKTTICIIGTGYVGLTAGTCLADMGNSVICVDNNKEKIEQLKKSIIPIYEPGLEELININTASGRLSFTTDIKEAVEKSKVCFIAVGTPQSEDGSCNLSYVFAAAKDIAKYMNEPKIIVNKSTVPVGTAQKIAEIIKKNTNFDFDIVSNPEFLKQGCAVDDFLSPDRVIIGAESEKARTIMQEIYAPFMRTANRVIFMDIKSAEMTKYVANAFLATKISFINEISNLCEKAGANIDMVRTGITTDSRIGKQFLFPGIGYGGSCFPKDVNSLISLADELDCDSSIIKAVKKTNEKQREIFINKILKFYKNDVKNKTFAVWGLAFKPKTNDMREAPSVTVINNLLEQGAVIKVYDPKAMDNAKKIFKDKIYYAKDAYDALIDANAMLLITEWNEFRYLDTDKMQELMKALVIFDARNQYDAEKLLHLGFKYIKFGQSTFG